MFQILSIPLKILVPKGRNGNLKLKICQARRKK